MNNRLFVLLLLAVVSLTKISAQTTEHYNDENNTEWRFVEIDSDDYSRARIVGVAGTIPADLVIPTDVSAGDENFIVTEIGEGVFKDNLTITSLTVAESVTTIWKNAFYGCSNLQSVSLPSCAINEGAFMYCSKLKNLQLSKGPVWMGLQSFAYCTSLTSVTLPEGVKAIGSQAFAHCYNLTDISLPSTVKTIGSKAFYDNAVICNVTVKMTTPVTIEYDTFSSYQNSTLYVPYGCKNKYLSADFWTGFKDIKELPDVIDFSDANVKAICVSKWDTDGDGELSKKEATDVTNLYTTFMGNTNISSFDELQYFTNLTTIDQSAFNGCSSLKSIVIPHNVTSLGWMAFFGCRNLQIIVFPESLKSIGIESFKNCYSLSSITIPNNVESVGWSAFEGCTSLQKVMINDLESWCKIGFGLDGNPLTYAKHLYVGESEVTDLTIPTTIENIHSYSFEGCTGLKTLTLHKDVKQIGFCAFNGCTNLERVNIENLEAWCNIEFGSGDDTYSPLYYAHHLFMNGEEITNLQIPDGIKSVKYESFQGCWGLTTVEVPSTVTSIGESAFAGCKDLASVKLPSTIKRIGEYAFAGCGNMTFVSTGVAIPLALEGNEFSNRTNATLYVPAGSKAAYEAADYWKDFKEIIEVPKCATPTISLLGGKLHFDCETDGVTFHYSVSIPEIANNEGNDVDLSSTYAISVYATKDGYEVSDIATANIDIRGIKGDINGDNNVNIVDVTSLIDIILNK